MRTTPESEIHITNVFTRRLQSAKIDLSSFGYQLRSTLMSELKQAVYDGWITASHPTNDSHNPNDRLLEVYTYLDLSKLTGIDATAKLRVYCRLSVMQGTITIRTIEKGFRIE